MKASVLIIKLKKSRRKKFKNETAKSIKKKLQKTRRELELEKLKDQLGCRGQSNI